MFQVYGSLANTKEQALGEIPDEKPSSSLTTVLSLARIAGASAGVYHGYKRNGDSIGWALGWGLLGGIFWPVTIPLSLAQGFGKKKEP